MPVTESRWKDKYSRLLDDYERLEQHSKQRASLLERGLVRSSLAAEGQDPKLDKQLQALRDSIRSANSQQLQQVVDDIERYLLATEDQRQQRQRTLLDALESLGSHLLNSSQESSTRQALKKLQGALKNSQQLNHNLHEWLLELSRLQTEVLQQGAPDNNQGGFFNRLFSRKDSPAHDSGPTAAADVQPAASVAADLPGKETDIAPDSSPQPAAGPAPVDNRQQLDVESLRHALIRLLDKLPVSEQEASLANSLQRELATSTSWQTLKQTLDQLTELIIRISDRRQQEFGHYLQELNSKLNLITSSVSQTRESYQNSIESAASLDQRLHSQVSELHEDVRQTTDLNELKQRVDQRLNQFVETLTQHQQQRQESEEKLLQRLQELNERVHLVENEAAQLTSQLVEQHEKARRDALTGLPNRAAWDERLLIEYQRMQRQREPLLLAVIDIDHFKRINDTYGHQAGDKVLKILASRLQQGIRKTDFMARYGGEEFVLLLPDTGLANGIGLLNKLRQRIADCPFHFKGEPVQITFSAGIGQLQPDEEPAATFARVDQALYAAKQGGRNQVKSAATDHS